MSRVSPVAAPTPTLVGNPIAPQPTAAPSLAPDSIGSGNTASPDKLAALAARANDPLGPDVHGTPYDAAINSAARANNLPPTLLASLIESESSFNPYSLSPTGAQGLTQLEPGTAGELGVKNAWDPTENINGGAQYLRKMLDQSNGDLTTALEKYNAGPYSKHLSGSFGYADGIEKRQAQFANAGGNVPVDLAQRLPTLHEGVGSADSQAVRAVQDRLGIPADGAFGPQTKAAVEKFQTERGLTADGVVGGATWKALGLAGASNASAPSQPSPAPGAPKPAPAKPPTTSGSAATTNHPTLDEGSRGAAVKQVQRAVGARVDGVFGPKTEAAIEKFQRAHGLDDDGIVGPKTWKAIDVAQHPKPVASKPTGPVASPTPAPTPNPTAGATPTPTPAKPGKTAPTPAGTGPTLDAAGPQLKSGAKGNDVAHLQKALGIPADGTFGPTTKAAVEAYQADHGLAVDGVLGPKTRASLAANPSSQVSGSPTNGHRRAAPREHAGLHDRRDATDRPRESEYDHATHGGHARLDVRTRLAEHHAHRRQLRSPQRRTELAFGRRRDRFRAAKRRSGESRRELAQCEPVRHQRRPFGRLRHCGKR
jgi:peptidoglycan hydrolase-like protein with peptidoglycan-binding domain